MIDRFLQASLLTFLLSLILQLGGASTKNPPLESNHSTHPFSAQVTKPLSNVINQVRLGWISHFDGSDPMQRLQKRLSFVRLSGIVSKDSHP